MRRGDIYLIDLNPVVGSEAQGEQVRSIAVQRVGARLGTVTGPLMADLDEALRLHLAL